MDAFGSAFDVVIVGALALPTILLVIHLFFSYHQPQLTKALLWVKKQNQPTLVSILLFAMAYPMGSAVSRIAQDFFDDADLHLHLNAFGYERWLRLPIATETNIRTDVFCDATKQIEKLPGATPADGTPQPSPSNAKDTLCQSNNGRLGPKTKDAWRQRQQLEDLATRVFRFQEAALLLQGTDNNERLRQFHDQIIVLRGAAFNGMIAFSLCLFWWLSGFHTKLRWIVPVILSILGINALLNHLFERAASDPPYMEFTLLALAASGWYVMWPRAPQPPGEIQPSNSRGKIRSAYLLLAAFLTASSFLGWWSTQVLYDQQVFYSYQGLLLSPRSPASGK